jgi:hypothetical protein
VDLDEPSSEFTVWIGKRMTSGWFVVLGEQEMAELLVEG